MLKVNVPSTVRAEKHLRRASCLSSDAVGDCVRISGPKTGRYYAVTRFDPSNPSEAQSVGIITKKYSSTLCRVQFFGPMVAVYTALTPGSRYFVGSDGRLTALPPTPAPSSSMFVQLMGVALNTDELLLNPHIPMLRHG